MVNPANKSELYSLTLQAIEGRISEDDFCRLENHLEQSSQARQLYSELNIMYAYLRRPSLSFDMHAVGNQDEPSQDDNLWQLLAEYEKTAPEVALEEQLPEREIIQKVVYEKHPHKLSKFTVFSGIFSAAAILMIVVFSKFTPERYAVEVATLVDQVNTKWVQADNLPKNGDRLLTNKAPLNLQSGVVKIQYDEGVDVCIEGPALFEIDKLGIYLEYGRLYSHVSKTGVGFTVKTTTSQFVDLGTEFGIQAEVNGSSELHVIKGKVQLFAGPKEKAKSSLVVTENNAVRYNANSSKVNEIPIQKHSFVRLIDSRAERIWRGEHMNMASIVAGTDKFKGVQSLVGIDPLNGEYATMIVGKDRKTDFTYHSVLDSDFIDGVFVPDGEKGPIQITSSGHTFNCPDTSGVFTHEIAAYTGSIGNQQTTVPPMLLTDRELDDESFLFLHSNIGITYDLQAIRQSLSQLDLKSFKGEAGFGEIEDLDNGQELPDVDFWILVDGQVRYEKKELRAEDGAISFDVELSGRDRFLTLIVTDGLRPGDKREFPFGRDGFYLIGPELCLMEKQ